MNPLSLEDPVGLPIMGGVGGVQPIADPAVIQAQQMALNAPTSGLQLPPMLDRPSTSEKLLNLGLAMIAADQQGMGLGGSIAAGLKSLHDTERDYISRRRQDRADMLAEYELLSRIRERQNAEQATARRLAAFEKAKKERPELANLIDLDPELAAKTIAEGMVAKPTYEGTSMEAQDANILLSGDPSSREYLAAYNRQAAPKITIGADGVPVTITPDMSAYNAPTFGKAAGASTAQETGQAGGVKFGDPTASVIEGLDIAEGARPSVQDAKVVKEIAEAHKNISELMAQRRALVEKDATPMAGSEAAIQLDQNTSQLALKIKALEQTGALDKGSVDVMMNAIGDPVIRGIDDFTAPFSGAAKSVTKYRGGKKLQDEMLSSGQKYIDNTLKSAVEARGYKFKTPPKPTQSAVQSSGDGQKPPVMQSPNLTAAPAMSTPADVPAGLPVVPPAAATPTSTAGTIPTPRSREEFDALPSGARFINPKDGQVRIKP